MRIAQISRVASHVFFIVPVKSARSDTENGPGCARGGDILINASASTMFSSSFVARESGTERVCVGFALAFGGRTLAHTAAHLMLKGYSKYPMVLLVMCPLQCDPPPSPLPPWCFRYGETGLRVRVSRRGFSAWLCQTRKREYALLAVRNLCEDNPANQASIAALQPQGPTPGMEEALADMGLEGHVDSQGTFRVGPRPV